VESALAKKGVDDGIRVRLLMGAARLRPSGSDDARKAAEEAITRARRVGDPVGLAQALGVHVQVTWDPRTAVDRLAALDQLIDMADEHHALELAGEGRNWRAATLLELGHNEAAERDRRIVEAWAQDSRLPFFEGLAAMWTVASLLAAGRLAEAEDCLAGWPESVLDSPNFGAAHLLQHLMLRRAQGRPEGLASAIDVAVADPDAPRAWAMVRPIVLVEEARCGEALVALRQEIASLDELPVDWLWLASIAFLADAAIALEDARSAIELIDELRPFVGRHAIVAHGIVQLGSIDDRLDALRRVRGSVGRNLAAQAS